MSVFVTDSPVTPVTLRSSEIVAFSCLNYGGTERFAPL